eukprot:scpid37576/ scgid13460/ 
MKPMLLDVCNSATVLLHCWTSVTQQRFCCTVAEKSGGVHECSPGVWHRSSIQQLAAWNTKISRTSALTATNSIYAGWPLGPCTKGHCYPEQVLQIMIPETCWQKVSCPQKK